MPATKTSLLSEHLLRSLMAAGQSDVLVGLPTRNHAAIAGPVARAVLDAFGGPFMRQRTVLLNLDAGSTDGTPDVVRDAGGSSAGVVAQYRLRSIHRITAQSHGVPVRGSTLQLLFTAAELLRARAVVVLDPTAACTTEDVIRWINAVLEHGADYVKPSLPRRWDEGPLITQLVRPLFSAAYGHQLLEPIDTQLACSGAFAADAVRRDYWSAPQAEVGIDAFLSTDAMGARYRLAQVATEARGRPDAAQRLSLSTVFEQVASSALACLARAPARWLEVSDMQLVPVLGPALAPPSKAAPPFDLDGFSSAFRLGIDALAPLMTLVLGQPLYARLDAAARAEPIQLDDDLWAEVVFACVGAALRRSLPLAQLAQMLEPLYLGRVTSHSLQFERAAPADDAGDGSADDARSGDPERLVGAFQARKAAFAAWWLNQQEVK